MNEKTITCWRLPLVLGLAAVVTILATISCFGTLDDSIGPDPNHPAINYSNAPNDPVTELNHQLADGTAHLKFDGEQGYLRSVLEQLHVPIESQIVVFSKTSVQMYRITPRNPRTLFFNDSVAVGWVRGGFIELAAQDPEQGIIFYTLEQKEVAKPSFTRTTSCLTCHISYASLGVPGMLVRSVLTGPNGLPLRQLGDYTTDHRNPFEQRWGGWYVTGHSGSMRHLGNAIIADPAKPAFTVTRANQNLDSLKGKFDTDAYLSPYSDIVALMVYEHQMHMMDLLIRASWDTRVALFEEQSFSAEAQQQRHMATVRQIQDTAKEIVDYMLFVDESPLPHKIEGTSGFTKEFSSQGPRDSLGRSLRDLDLQRRLMRYPCSYMIYSDAFDHLPSQIKDAIYQRMWEILSGKERAAQYTRISLKDRQAIVEILRQTKKDIPDYFQTVR